MKSKVIKHPFRIGDKVQVMHDMTFVGRRPSFVCDSEVTRITTVYFWIKSNATDMKCHGKNGRFVGGSGNYLVLLKSQ
jgi:hypothetical protein